MKLNKILIIICITLFYFQSIVFGTLIFEDDFNRADSSTVGNGWIETGSANADPQILSNQLYLYDNDATSYADVTQDFGNKDPEYISFKMKSQDVTDATSFMLNSDNGGGYNVVINCQMFTEILRCYYNSGWQTVMSVSDNTEYFIEFKNINYSSNNFDIYVDNVLKTTGANFYQADVSDLVSQVYFKIGGGVTSIGNSYIDDVCVSDSFSECFFIPGSNKTISFTNIKVNDETLLNNSYFNISNFEFYVEVLNESTNANINLSYSLNSGNYTLFNTGAYSSKLFGFPTKNINGIFYPMSANTNTAKQFCQENGYNNTLGYVVGSLGSSTAFYNGSNWIIRTDLNIANTDTCLIKNNLVGNLKLLNITDGNYNISFFANNNETNITSSIYSFIVDTINPIINNNILPEYNSYTIDGFNSSCSDTNLLSCNISINGQNVLLNTSSFNFTQNGNISYIIQAYDLSGNTINETGLILINPYQYFNFQLENGTVITNYTLGGESFENEAKFTVYNDLLSLGSNTLLFEKIGYASTNVTFNLNTTSQLNITTNVTQSKIIINIYDRETGDLITSNTSIVLVASTGFMSSTVTGQINISDLNFINELYQVIIGNDDYETETLYFNYDNQVNINLNAYLIKSNQTNLGNVIISVVADTGQLIQGAICKALEWKPSLSSYVSVAEGLSNSNGITNLNIELNTKLYKFSCSKASVISTTGSQIITITDTTIPITLQVTTPTPVNIYKSLSYSLINTTLNATHQRFIFTFNDNNNVVSQSCLKIYKKDGLKLTDLQSSCIDSNTGQIQLIQNINQTYTILVQGTVLQDNINNVLKTIIFYPYLHLTKSLKEYGLDILLPLVFTLLGISLGLLLKPQNIYISIASTFILVWVSVGIVPTIISGSIAMFVTFICVLMFWGGYRGK